ncbi:YybS family protein [Paraclostridium tenue]|uniref:YybS family protein n=1 Tax=Paraclostridium tenue TaxID=1737 RepID=A0ABP3XH83_9FIRM
MNDKTKLTQAAILTAVAIIFCIATAYIPFLGLLMVVIPVPYAIIATMTGHKYALISAIASFFILILTVNFVYALNLVLMSMLPGIAVGYMINKDSNIEDRNKNFKPIFFGTVAFLISTIVFFTISKALFNIDLIEQFSKMLKTTVETQFAIMESTNIIQKGDIAPKDIINVMQNTIPTMLFACSIIASLITYYVEAFILRRIKRLNYKLPKFSDFYLPGNAIITSLLLYLLTMFLSMLNIGLYTDAIILNLQLIFSILFLLQGISVSIYFIKEWRKKSPSKIGFAIMAVFLLSGSMILSFVGMLDSAIDFRKVRNYKST